MSAVSGPADAPELWEECDIGPYHWPPEKQTGSVQIDVGTGLDVEIQKPNGKDPARSKVKGRKPATVEMAFQFTRLVWARGNEIRLALDPAGINSGKVWEITHPECNGRGVRNVMIKGASKLTTTGDKYSFTLTADGWTEPSIAAVGGTSTPKTSIPAGGNINIGGPPSNLNFGPDQAVDMPLGEIQPTGFDSPGKKPKAVP